LIDFNNFYISGNGNECPLQVSYLLVYFTWCKYNVTVTWHWWAATASAAWEYDLEQSLIDDAVDQRPTRLCACVCTNGGHFEHALWLSIFSLYLMNLMFHTTLDVVGSIQSVRYKSMKSDVSFSEGSVNIYVFHVCVKMFFLLMAVHKL